MATQPNPKVAKLTRDCGSVDEQVESLLMLRCFWGMECIISAAIAIAVAVVAAVFIAVVAAVFVVAAVAAVAVAATVLFLFLLLVLLFLTADG